VMNREGEGRRQDEILRKKILVVRLIAWTGDGRPVQLEALRLRHQIGSLWPRDQQELAALSARRWRGNLKDNNTKEKKRGEGKKVRVRLRLTRGVGTACLCLSRGKAITA